MTFKSIAVKTGIATVALTALGLAAAMPASAHTNNMYSYVYDGQSEQAGYVTYSKTDGAVAFLPTTFVPEDEFVAGIEVFNERGTEVGEIGDLGYYVLTWDHKTGEVGDYIAAYFAGDLEGFEVENLIGLDTLNDGTTVSLAQYVTFEGDLEERVLHSLIVSVNSGTGELIGLVDITDALNIEDETLYNLTSLATDPATGVTYVFLQSAFDDAALYFLPVTVGTETVGEPTLFQGASFEAGWIAGSDFDADGSLYFNYIDYVDEGIRTLNKLGAPSTWVEENRQVISLAPAQYDDFNLAEQALTIEHTALAATGSELPIAAWLIVGTVAVLAGGTTVMVARRRSEAGTV